MPSAEKQTLEAAKSESAAQSEPKSVENTQKENAPDQEKSVPAIQQVISIISNKVRNLEKRKNKLDGYIKEEESGKELSSEQQKAVSKYDEVVQQLSLSKEFCKQFNVIAAAASKEAKREARKSVFSRQLQEALKVREVLMIQDLLQRLKDDGIRKDFLSGRNGACRVDKDEMKFIDMFALVVIPTRPSFSNEPTFSNSAKTSADHWSFLIDGRNRLFMDTGITYEKAKEMLNRIQSCGYWEKDVKIVEVTEENRAETETPNTEDLESKEEKPESVVGEKTHPVLAPAPAQVPTPTFNGNNANMMPVQQQQQHQPMPQAPMARIPRQQHQQQQAPLPPPTNMKTTVTAVENAYFNQLKYSQPQAQLMSNNGLPIAPVQSDLGSANFSFLQDDELDSSPAVPGSQQKMPVNVIQPKQSPAQQQHQHQQMPPQQLPPTQQFKNANYHPQSPNPAGQMYPPGLKVQHSTHIPVNYPSPQQPAAPSQVPPNNMIPKQPQPVNGNQNQIPGYGASTPPIQQQQQQGSQPTSRPATAYPTMVPKAQYQQPLHTNNPQNLQNAKPLDQKPMINQKMDGSGEMKSNDASSRNVQAPEKDNKPREDYQQQPQIDTWTNETAAQSGGNSNYSSRSSGGYNRSNRSAGNGTGAKYNNYRNPQQSRNYNENNGGGDSPREGQAAAGTFFRNNERYNGSQQSGGRYDNRDNRGGNAGGNFKPREGNYRAGSGRFAGSASASAQGSSNPAQRK